MKTINILSLALVSYIVFSLSAIAASVDETLDIGPDRQIEVEIKAGSIEIESWAEETLRVVGSISGNDDDFEFKDTGDAVIIENIGKGTFWGGDSSSANLTIYAPKSSNWKVRTISGSVSAKGLEGPIRTNTVSGDIEILGGTDNISLESISGNIDIENATGKLVVASVSGDIEVLATTQTFDAQTVSGDIEAEIGTTDLVEIESVSGDIDILMGLSKDGRFDASTVSGDIDLRFQNDNLGARFDIATGPGGDIRNKLSDAKASSKGWTSSELDFEVGDGDARVEITTMSGTITLRK